ncbi:hypothetical protein CSIRO_0410 [Bradyrhizobiaceae bacterium SG-6C]|nr:hypothetical protein CSIRO_0410 [Bradyrhizobiaceae bacterium SG-6C]
MQDALYLFHIVRGPLRSLAQDWMCRSLRRSAFGESAGLDRYCPSCDASTTNDGRAIAMGTG